MQPSYFHHIVSYVIPLKMKKSSSRTNPVLELFLHHGQWQLCTEDAMYSDGNRYRPLKLAFDKIEKQLPTMQKVCLLGGGLGSGIAILASKQIYPQYTFVEIDAKVLAWAKALMPKSLSHQIQFICADAKDFIAENKTVFDILIIDIFQSRVVPGFVTTKAFLEDCKKCISKNGYLIINYIEQNQAAFLSLQETLQSMFSHVKIIPLGVNRIVIATA